MEWLSLIASVFAVIVAIIVLYLQKQSDKNLKRVENNTDKLSSEVQKISDIQNQIKFETEKNRLMSFFQSLTEEDKKYFKSDIHKIFYEGSYKFQTTENSKITTKSNNFKVSFIKESSTQFALPKMAYPFSRTGDFPYFCVQVIKICSQNNNIPIKEGEYYYLTYLFNDKNWYMNKNYPIDGNPFSQKIEVIFAGTNFSGKGLPSADKFCKDC